MLLFQSLPLNTNRNVPKTQQKMSPKVIFSAKRFGVDVRLHRGVFHLPFNRTIKPLCVYSVTHTIHPSLLISGDKLWIRTRCDPAVNRKATVKRFDGFPYSLNICLFHNKTDNMQHSTPLLPFPPNLAAQASV